MKIDSIRGAIRLAAFVLPVTWWPASALGQAARAESFGVSVTSATVNQKTPSAVLPADGGTVQDQSSDVTVGTMVTAENVFAIAGGDGTDPADAVSSATVGRVSILGGLITANGVVAMATSTSDNSNADGSSLAYLVVNGVEVSDPAPNTRLDLPGAGYVVLNEQIPNGNGITVNMIHVVLQQVGLLGTRTTGEIIVGSASSSVN